jgi:hypothetical protein
LTKEPTEQTLAETILQTTREDKPETVSQLVDQVHAKVSSFSRNQILDAVMKLQQEGRLKIKATLPPSPSLSSYLKSSEALWFWATVATTIIASISAFTIPEDAFPLVIVRYVFGAVLILWLPGYVFIKALFPTALTAKTAEKNLDIIERVALSLGISLALVPIVGLLLNYTPWGISLTPITLSLAALTTILAVTALLREKTIANSKKDQIDRIQIPNSEKT